MEGKTSSGLGGKIQTQTEEVDQPQLVGEHGQENRNAQCSHQRMDKLLQNREYEDHTTQNRRTIENTHEDSHMETMEEEQEAILGATETRGTRVDGEAVCRVW